MTQELIAASTYFLRWNLERIERCLAELSEAEVWQRPSPQSNAVGIQLLHLEGNIRQWILSGLAGQPDIRQRAAEFDPLETIPKAEALARLRQTIEAATGAIEAATEASLKPERAVQAYVHDGVYIIMHVVEHLSYHTGQIVFWTKQLRDKDLNFYGSDDLNQTN